MKSLSKLFSVREVSTKQSIKPNGCSIVILSFPLAFILVILDATVLEIRHAAAIQLVPVAAWVS